jgi:hypothetical protein
VELSGVQPPEGTSAGIHGENFHPNELDVDPLAERLAVDERPGGDERERRQRRNGAARRPSSPFYGVLLGGTRKGRSFAALRMT